MEERPVSQSIADRKGGTHENVGPRIKHQFMENYDGEVGEINRSPSRTVPDQSLTVQQLLLNHTQRLDSDITQYPAEYFEDIEIPVIRDLNDLQEARERFIARANEIEELFKKQKDETKGYSKRTTDADSSSRTDSRKEGSREADTEPSAE